MSDLTLSSLLPEWPAPSSESPILGVVRGEGIGPSLVDGALRVLSSATAQCGVSVAVDVAPDFADRDEYGMSLDDVARNFYESCFDAHIPIFHGPAGGRFVYELRREFGLGVKLTPIVPLPAMRDVSVVRPERLDGVDILIVRDNAGGIYQGTFGWKADGTEATHEARYERGQVESVIDVAMRAAEQRHQRLAVVTKPGGLPTISRMWHEVARERALAGIELDFIEIDNACFQLVAHPARFDVIVAPNMFGDVLGDTATALLGSRGLAYSANFGTAGHAVYQTAHGAAHDLAARDTANPIAQIRTLAWLVRASLGLDSVADLMEGAVISVLTRGTRTADIAGDSSTVVGTDDMCRLIAQFIDEGEEAW